MCRLCTIPVLDDLASMECNHILSPFDVADGEQAVRCIQCAPEDSTDGILDWLLNKRHACLHDMIRDASRLEYLLACERDPAGAEAFALTTLLVACLS